MTDWCAHGYKTPLKSVKKRKSMNTCSCGAWGLVSPAHWPFSPQNWQPEARNPSWHAAGPELPVRPGHWPPAWMPTVQDSARRSLPECPKRTGLGQTVQGHAAMHSTCPPSPVLPIGQSRRGCSAGTPGSKLGICITVDVAATYLYITDGQL